MKFMLLLLCLVLEPVIGFTEYQTRIIRQQAINHKAPSGAAIVDAVLTQGDLAFTNQMQMTCHVDAVRFQCCPNSFANAVIHELHHLNMRQHNPPGQFVKDDPMSYSVTIRANGEVVDDSFVLPPLSPAQPWSRQIIKPVPPVPPTPPTQLPVLPARTQARSQTMPPTPLRLPYLPLPVQIISPITGSTLTNASAPGR